MVERLKKMPVLKKTYDITKRRFDGNSLERKIVIFFFLLIFFVKMKKISKLCWQNQLGKCPREIMSSIEHFPNWCEN